MPASRQRWMGRGWGWGWVGATGRKSQRLHRVCTCVWCVCVCTKFSLIKLISLTGIVPIWQSVCERVDVCVRVRVYVRNCQLAKAKKKKSADD